MKDFRSTTRSAAWRRNIPFLIYDSNGNNVVVRVSLLVIVGSSLPGFGKDLNKN